MASENGFNGDKDNDLHAASASNGQEEPEKVSSVKGEKQDPESTKGDEKTNTVPFYKMFSFADSKDILLMIIATTVAAGNGLSMPLMTVLFGNLIDSFGNNQSNGNVVEAVSKGKLLAELLGTVLIQDAMGEKVGKFLQLISTFFGGFVIALVKGWLLILVMLSSIPLVVLSGGTIAIMISKMATRGQNAYAKAATVVEQTIGSIRPVNSISKLFAVIDFAFSCCTAAGLSVGVVMLIVFSSYALAVWFGGKMILEKGYTGGQVLNAKFLGTYGCFRSLGQASPCMTAFAAGQAAAFKMFETIKRKPEIDTYDMSGKFGEVLIDDINLKEFQLRWIRGKIGLVSQEPVLFTSSIRDNIAYGKEGATTEEIRAAAELANAARFIDKLPQGLDTMVGEHGTQLSGGQKQRVAIARAILKNPRILLLDDATSALDAESERIVQEALDRIMSNKTTVIVAHRLSTIRNADTIAVIHQGKMVEKGRLQPIVVYLKLLRLDRKWSYLIDMCYQGKAFLFDSLNCYFSCILLAVSCSTNTYFFTIQKTLTTTIETASRGFHPPAYLNKPEIPVILIGTMFAAAYGVILPIFGILIFRMIKTFYEPAGCKLIQRIRETCFDKVVRMEVGWFDEPDNSSGSIGARLSADAASRCTSLDGLSLASAMAGVVIAFVASWQMVFIILALIPLVGINGYIQAKFIKGFSADSKMTYEEASQAANDAVGSIRTVASFCAEEKVMQLYKKKSEGPMKTGIRQGLISGTGYGLSFFFLFSVYATSFYGGAQLVEHRKAIFADGFQVFLDLTMAAVGISQSSCFAPDSNKAKIAAASIFAIINRESKVDPSDESRRTLENVKGNIELRHVSFKYPSRPDIKIFQDLSLSIHAGKSGVITLDGVEIETLQLKWLRQQMGLVSQEPVLFNYTIRANIAYGKGGNTTEAEIVAASELANAHKFISSLKRLDTGWQICLTNDWLLIFSLIIQGYDTIVGERGLQLSGGQKQCVAIARAIVKSPKILLLDEAASALDAESEKVVQDALDKVTVNRTTVVVAHRLSTIKNADAIAVVKNGLIVEQGKHETLMNIKDGVYASLVQLLMTASTSQKS
ncbi:ABC transporter B family member 12 [Hibiscus syriacus]|uniref:ABC transporter B family member 12 n=1 Tax=Hibiscus syriacus TaxID=106335 RepID=A0A6A3A220_HIBSY|nr:ABC transporter B family member 12 [Hibiscus syriacus]